MRSLSQGLTFLCATACLSGFLAGCAPAASGDPSQQSGPMPAGGGAQSNYSFPTPTITSIAPNQVSLGDTVTVFGKDFIDPDHGTVSMYFLGTFTGSDNTPQRWDGTVPLTYVSPGKATFTLDSSFFFSPGAIDLGSFMGNFQAVNTLTGMAIDAETGDTRISDPLQFQMQAMPSIYIEQIRSVDDNCSLITSGTTAGSNLALGVRAIGFAPATTANPIQFSFSMNAPTMALSFAQDTYFSTWPLTLQPTLMTNAADGDYTFSYSITSDNATVIDPQHFQQVVTVNPAVMTPNGPSTDVKLARFASGTIPDGQDTSQLNIIVAARANDGTTLARAVNLASYSAIALVPSDQVDHDKEVDALAQTNCSSGGLTGQQYSYSEGSSDSRTRGISLNQSVQNTVGASIGTTVGGMIGTSALEPISYSFNASVTAQANAQSTKIFGVDVSQSVTTESHTSFTTTINVLPSFVGASYRQAIRSERYAFAVVYNTCGVPVQAGQLTLTNWRWNYDINQGASCDTVQPSSDALTPGPR